MFKLTTICAFTAVVSVLVPSDGGHERQDFKATFRALSADEQAKFDLSTIEGSSDFLRAIIVGIDDLVDENEKPVPYSDAVREKMIRFQFVRLALTRTYFEAIAKAAEGN